MVAESSRMVDRAAHVVCTAKASFSAAFGRRRRAAASTLNDYDARRLILCGK